MSEQNAVESVIQQYLDASYTGDGQKMRGVFHEAAHIYGLAPNGTLNDWDVDFFCNLVGGSPSSKSEGIARQDKLLSIDFTGANTCVARVGLRVRDRVFTDILSFVKADGAWKVAAKVLADVPA